MTRKEKREQAKQKQEKIAKEIFKVFMKELKNGDVKNASPTRTADLCANAAKAADLYVKDLLKTSPQDSVLIQRANTLSVEKYLHPFLNSLKRIFLTGHMN